VKDTIISSFIGVVTGAMERPGAREYIPGWLPMLLGTAAALGAMMADEDSTAEHVLNSLVQASSNWLGEWGFEGPGTEPKLATQATLQELQAQLASLSTQLQNLQP